MQLFFIFYKILFLSFLDKPFPILFCNTLPLAIYKVLMPFDPVELALSQGEVKCLIRSLINARTSVYCLDFGLSR